ncbi:MAG: hypothetical protein ABIJ97_17145 [Bacteroidota bacterium]
MKNILSGPVNKIVFALWLIAIHSFVVGIFLIFLPSSQVHIFGFEEHYGNFFRAQGGVFHLVMSVVYLMAAIDIYKSHNLITVSIIAKMIATLFLLIYYFAVNNIWTVLFSGIADFLMGFILIILYLNFKKIVARK